MDISDIESIVNEANKNNIYKDTGCETVRLSDVEYKGKKYSVINTVYDTELADINPHPNVVTYFGSLKVIDRMNHIFEAPDTTLQDLFAAPRNPERMNGYRDIIADLVNGLAYLHSYGVLVSNLNPTNVFIINNRAKICNPRNFYFLQNADVIALNRMINAIYVSWGNEYKTEPVSILTKEESDVFRNFGNIFDILRELKTLWPDREFDDYPLPPTPLISDNQTKDHQVKSILCSMYDVARAINNNHELFANMLRSSGNTSCDVDSGQTIIFECDTCRDRTDNYSTSDDSIYN